jgi:hypothetical protein
MSELKFTEEMFDGLYGHDTRVFAAEIANARLAQMLEACPVVSGIDDPCQPSDFMVGWISDPSAPWKKDLKHKTAHEAAAYTNTVVAPLQALAEGYRINLDKQVDENARLIVERDALLAESSRLKAKLEFLNDAIKNNEAFAAKHLDRELENARLVAERSQLLAESSRLKADNTKCVSVVSEYGEKVGTLRALLARARDSVAAGVYESYEELLANIDAALGAK